MKVLIRTFWNAAFIAAIYAAIKTFLLGEVFGWRELGYICFCFCVSFVLFLFINLKDKKVKK